MLLAQSLKPEPSLRTGRADLGRQQHQLHFNLKLNHCGKTDLIWPELKEIAEYKGPDSVMFGNEAEAFSVGPFPSAEGTT